MYNYPPQVDAQGRPLLPPPPDVQAQTALLAQLGAPPPTQDVMASPQMPQMPQFNIPGPIAPSTPPMSPAEAEYMRVANAQPRMEDYKPSKLRTVGNAIAAGLAGIAGGPKVGYEIGASLGRGGYDNATEQWQARLKAIQPGVGFAEKRAEQGLEAARLANTGANVQSQIEKRQADETNAKDRTKIMSDAQEAKRVHMLQLDKWLQWKMAHPDHNFTEYLMSLPKDQQDQAMEMYKTAKQAGMKTFDQLEGEAEAKAKGTAKVAASPLGQQAAAVTSGARAAASTTARLNIEENPERYKPIIDNARALQGDPVAYAEYVSKQTPAVRSAIFKEIPTTSLVTGEKQKGQIGNANISLLHIKTLKDYLKDPYIREHLGPILGRIESAQGKIGGNWVGATDVDKRKEQEFLNFMSMAIIWEASVFGGGRPSWQLIQQLKSQGIKPAQIPSQFEGGLDAMEKSAHNTIRGATGGIPPKDQQATPPKRVYHPDIKQWKDN